MMFPFSSLLLQFIDRWNTHEIPTRAASLAYFAIFSLAPLLVMMIGIGGLLLDQLYIQEQILSFVSRTLGGESELFLKGLMESQDYASNGLLSFLFGLFTLFLGATGMVGQLQGSLNKIWEVTSKDSNGFIAFFKSRFLAILLVVFLSILLALSLLVTSTASYVHSLVGEKIPLYTMVVPFFDGVLTLSYLTLFFVLIFTYLPARKVSIKKILPGACLSACILYLGKTLLSLYLTMTTSLSPFGATSALVVILFWIYFMSLCVFLGAECTRMLEER